MLAPWATLFAELECCGAAAPPPSLVNFYFEEEPVRSLLLRRSNEPMAWSELLPIDVTPCPMTCWLVSIPSWRAPPLRLCDVLLAFRFTDCLLFGLLIECGCLGS